MRNGFCCSLGTHEDGAGTNKQHVTTKNTAKLDRETDELKHDKVPLDVGKIIQQGRNAKGMSQKDLATVRVLFPLHITIICAHCAAGRQT